MRAFVVFLLMAGSVYAGPKEQVAVAEAYVWMCAHLRPEQQADDYSGGRRSSLPGAEVHSTSINPVSAVSDVATSAGLLPPTDGKGMTPEQGRSAIVLEIDKPVASAWTQRFAPIETVTTTASWCAVCKRQQKNNGIGDENVFHTYIDVKDITDEDLKLVMRRVGELIPVTAWRDARGTLRYHVGYITTAEIWQKIQRNNPPKREPLPNVAASGPAGAIYASGQIRQVLDYFRQYVGEGVKAEIGWDRTGANSFPLLSKGDYSTLALFGAFGRFRLSAKGAVNLPIESAGFSYSVDGEDISIDPDKITLKGLARQLNPTIRQNQTVGAGPSQFGPLTLLSVFSIISDVWNLLHPTADIILGGNVSASAILNGDELTIDFSQCPRIKAVWLFTFDLAVKRVEISTSKVFVEFTGSRFIQSRTFEVR